MAEKYLGAAKSIHIYFSVNPNDTQKKATIPRAVIVEYEELVMLEVRGIRKHQNLDENIRTIVKQRLEIEGWLNAYYLKVFSDSERIDILKEKSESGLELSVDDLRFLYGVDKHIISFGYYDDPRIKAITAKRDYKKDILAIFDITEDQLAFDVSEIVKEKTKIYIGPLIPELLPFLQYLEEAYETLSKPIMKSFVADPQLDITTIHTSFHRTDIKKVNRIFREVILKRMMRFILRKDDTQTKKNQKKTYKVAQIPTTMLDLQKAQGSIKDVNTKIAEFGLNIVASAETACQVIPRLTNTCQFNEAQIVIHGVNNLYGFISLRTDPIGEHDIALMQENDRYEVHMETYPSGYQETYLFEVTSN